MAWKKNDMAAVQIEDMSQEGLGIGKADGYTLFVKDTVIGDLARVRITKTRKNYGFARLEELLSPSASGRSRPARWPVPAAAVSCR